MRHFKKLWDWLSMSRTERLILFIASKGYPVHFYHRNEREGKSFITIAIGGNTIRVNAKDGIYKALKMIAKFSLDVA